MLETVKINILVNAKIYSRSKIERGDFSLGEKM